ncbi:MAG TPA: hypothetical protein VI386_05115 [Candidatus Sulfotelmatobacter sp.]
MATNTYSAPSDVQSSLSEVVRLVDAELRGLLARREEVSARIRELNLAVNALEEFRGRSAPDNAANTPARRRRPTLNGNAPSATAPYLPVDQNGSKAKSDLILRRACRIALLETLGPLSEREVYTRIIRRGSFSFSSPSFARRAIRQELYALLETGEAVCLANECDRRWQRQLHEADL